MRTTLLKHVLPDGSWHVDWLIEVAPGQAPRIPTFRLADRPDREGVHGFDARHLPDHRRLYMDYAGPISPCPNLGDRGRVEPLATGPVEAAAGWPGQLDVTVRLAGRRWRWQGRPIDDAIWRFETLRTDD